MPKPTNASGIASIGATKYNIEAKTQTIVEIGGSV